MWCVYFIVIFFFITILVIHFVSGCVPFKVNEGTISPVQVWYEIGETVTVFCGKGFTLIGEDTVVCTRRGTWHTGPTCEGQYALKSFVYTSEKLRQDV